MIGADQAIKAWARMAADGTEGNTFFPLWPGVFEFTLKYNEGVAFGMLSGFGKALWPIAVIITAACAYMNYKQDKEPMSIHVGLGLVASGAVGNLIDRLWLGKVTDMFHFRLIDFPVFNWADSCITVGAGLLILVWGMQSMHSKSPAPVNHESDPPLPS